MVALQDIRASNARINSSLPAGLVGVFVGATNGIGETTLREFARRANAPRVYFVGRSKEAGDRIAAECKSLNPSGQFTFIQSDLSLIRNADVVCRTIKEKEKHINVLWLSQGSLVQGVRTEEDMNMIMVLMHYSRVRFMVNLLPLLRAAPGLKRVVSCLAGTKEGQMNLDDFQGWSVPASEVHSSRGHVASAATLSMEHLAKQAPEISFIHCFPGLVRSGIGRGTGMWKLRAILALMYPFAAADTRESGERHLYLLTSAKFPAKSGTEAVQGVSVGTAVEQADDTFGKRSGGTYSVDQYLEHQSKDLLGVLSRLRQAGATERMWKLTQDDFVRITGSTEE